MTSLSSFINRISILKQIPVFSKLKWYELQRIARRAIVAEYHKGEVIRKEGDPPDFFYCLVSGRVQAYTTNTKGQRSETDFILRGMHFGIISLLTGENHSMTYEAINDSVVLKISKEHFDAILKSIPRLAIELSQNLSQRIRRNVKGDKNVFESTIITIYSPVKGTGSSTYALNLAMKLEKETKKKVIFVSVHSKQVQQPATHFHKEGSSPVWKVESVNLSEVVGDHEKTIGSVIKKDLDIDLLNVACDSSDLSLKKQISHLVSSLVGDYHYVVVDLPNEMDEVVLETLTQSDIVHLITSDRRNDLELIRRVIDRLQFNLKENFREEKIRVIIRPAHEKVYLTFEEIDNFIDYSVYALIPNIQTSELIPNTTVKSISFTHCSEESAYTKTVTRIARQIGGVMVGLVLGGGAALGVAHVGVIRVLEQENIPIDIIVGSSMGALIAALWAIGKKAKDLEAVAREFQNSKAMIKLFDPVIPVSGLIGGRLIKRWLRGHLGDRTFYSSNLPLKIVAYDLIRREEIIIESGSLVDAVRQSIAIPGVIEPVIKGEQVIIDGGVLNPLPTNVLASRGIKKIIAVNVLQSPSDSSEGFDMIKHQLKEQASVPFSEKPFHYLSLRVGGSLKKMFAPNIPDIIVRTLQATEYVIAEQSAQLADVLIHPDLVGINWFELYKVDELINAGEEATRALLPQIKKLVEQTQ